MQQKLMYSLTTVANNYHYIHNIILKNTNSRMFRHQGVP